MKLISDLFMFIITMIVGMAQLAFYLAIALMGIALVCACPWVLILLLFL